QEIVPYKNVNHYILEPYSQGGGDENEGDLGGQNHQAARFKALWTPSDRFTGTLSLDFAHQDQSSIPNTVLAVYPDPRLGPPGGLGAFFYNACVAGIPLGPLCTTPRAAGYPTGSSGLPAISDYPVGSLIPIDSSTTQTGDIDKTYANGPDFAK